MVEDELVEEIPDADRFWAARSDTAFLAACEERENDWWEYAENHGYVEMWLAMIAEYFGQDPNTLAGFDAAGVGFDGSEAELVRFRVAMLRIFVRQLINSATRERPAFKAGALNSSYGARAAVDTVDSFTNALYETCMGEKRERRLVERGEIAGRTYVWGQWDSTAGDKSEKPIMLPPNSVEMPMGGFNMEPIPTGQVETVTSGAPRCRIKCPWDVCEDPTVDDDEDHGWRRVRERRSKHELMALYPEKRDAIRGASVGDETAYELMFAFDSDLPRDDDVIVKHWYIPPCASMPEGHYAITLGKTVLERMPWADAPVPGDYIPVLVYEPSEMLECSFGYSESWDQLVVQQMLTQVISDIATNISALGRQFLMLPQSSEISPEQLANGMFAAYVPDDQVGKIAAPQLAQVGTGAQWFVGFLQEFTQMLAGENSVSMGNPSENIKSGTMAALFHAIALEKKHGPQAALDGVRSKVATMLVDFVRRFAQGPMLVKLIGPDEAPKLAELTPDKFEGVRQVFIETANPLLKSRSGQMEVAEYLKGIPGAVKTPAQAIQALSTGRVKPMYQSAQAELDLIQWENERLREGTPIEQISEPVLDSAGLPVLDLTGQPTVETYEVTPKVPVVTIHDHPAHINEHLTVAYDQNAQPDARKAAFAHVLWHFREWQNMPPELALLRGFAPPQAPAPPPGMKPGDDGPPKGGKGAPGTPPVDKVDAGIPKPAKPPEGAAVKEA